MKRTITYLLLTITIAIVTSCRKEEDDLFTTATVVITTDASEEVERVQGQAVFTNINSRKETSTAEFTGNRLTVELLRGSYLISIDGVLSYRDNSGASVMKQFRAQTDYVEIMDKTENIITLKAILLE